MARFVVKIEVNTSISIDWSTWMFFNELVSILGSVTDSKTEGGMTKTCGSFREKCRP